MPTRGTALLREALLAGEVGCDVKLHRNQAGEVAAVEALLALNIENNA
jgi:hypothetical protein